MTWTEGVLDISDTFEIHGGYLGIISFSVFVIVIITYILYVGAVGALIGKTIKKINENLKNKN